MYVCTVCCKLLELRNRESDGGFIPIPCSWSISGSSVPSLFYVSVYWSISSPVPRCLMPLGLFLVCQKGAAFVFWWLSNLTQLWSCFIWLQQGIVQSQFDPFLHRESLVSNVMKVSLNCRCNIANTDINLLDYNDWLCIIILAHTHL
jgi:hypothetical protein